MKVLWFSNCVLSKSASTGTGSWLFAMRDLIANDVELVNITDNLSSDIIKNEGNGIREYLLPNWKLKGGVPSVDNIKKIADIVQTETPDIIHIWGVEKYWALLFSRGYIKFDKVLLEMQGVVSACQDVYYGGLTPSDCKKLISLRSIFDGNSRISYTYRVYKRKALYEKELLKSFDNIAVQSEWTKDQLSTLCKEKTSFYFSRRPIRQDFYEAKKWQKQINTSPVIFCSMSYYKPYKGLHFLLKALQILVNQFPTITLRIAGTNLIKRPFYKLSDYEQFIISEIKSMRLESRIHFCGSLKASDLVNEIQTANVIVNPSLVESYSAAAAEALYLGAPTVLAYSGAMVNFSKEKSVALYYSPMDYRSLAVKIKLILDTEININKLTENAIEVLEKKCSPIEVKQCQINTYNRIICSQIK